jgi:hypothetical protein
MRKCVKYFPFIIIALSSLLGIINGLKIPVTEDLSNNLWELIDFFDMSEELHEIGKSWYLIAKHNILWSFLYGILGLLSGGIFAMKFLYNGWFIWAQGFKHYIDIPTRIFIILESFGMTGIVVSVMSLGYDVLIKKKYRVYQSIAIGVCLIFLIIGAVVETYGITN